MSGDYENWQWVTVVHKKKGSPQSKVAGNHGRQIETQPKFSGGANKKAPAKNTIKLDQKMESFRHAKVSMEVGKAIATGCQLKECEAGKCIPSKGILSKIERVLGVKVRGKEKGRPLCGQDNK